MTPLSYAMVISCSATWQHRDGRQPGEHYITHDALGRKAETHEKKGLFIESRIQHSSEEIKVGVLRWNVFLLLILV